MSDLFNILLIGVGGQGIGLLSETILRACDKADLKVKSVDTHGLAQRGGTVISNIRVGNAFSPLVRRNSADISIALEINEAFRSVAQYLKPGGILVYYDTHWEPLGVRLKKEPKMKEEELMEKAEKYKISVHKVFSELVYDSRMQNTAVLAYLAKKELIPALKISHYESALEELMEGKVLEENLKLFFAVLK